MEKPLAPVEVFYSCSDSLADAPLLEQLERHLSALQREGLISTWHKRQIVAGSVRQVELDRHLNEDIPELLVKDGIDPNQIVLIGHPANPS
jgi:hypothetical protein